MIEIFSINRSSCCTQCVAHNEDALNHHQTFDALLCSMKRSSHRSPRVDSQRLSSDQPNRRSGMTLIEIILAVALSVVVAVGAFAAFDRTNDDASQRVCAAQRAALQIEADRYRRREGRSAGTNLGRLLNSQYWNETALPRCPLDRRAYRLDGGAVVTCRLHGN